MGARSAFALVALVATTTHALSDEALAKFQAATAANKIAEPFDPPHEADEWYMVTIANVSVGYMHTTVTVNDEFVRTMEVMDVQVSRGQDTSRMAFETVFDEIPFTTAPAPETVAAEKQTTGGVQVMAYDQRFANSEVRMNASFAPEGVTLVSHNGEKWHTSELPLPEESWLGRMRARLEFAKQCRAGETEIVVQTMRPELGPRVVNLSSTLVDILPVWDGTEYVDASVWSVQVYAC